MKRHKYTFPDRASAEAECERKNRYLTITSIALGDVLSGKVRYYRKGNYRIGLVRPGSCDGPKVIVEWRPAGQRPSANVHYLDELAAEIRRARVGSNDPDTIALCDLLSEVQLDAERIATAEWKAERNARIMAQELKPVLVD